MNNLPTAAFKRTQISGVAEVLNHSYVALTFEPKALGPFNKKLEALLGESYAELKQHRDLRDGADSYHLTAVTPAEFRQLKKALKNEGKRVELPTEPFDVELLGIGYGESESSACWFAICTSPAVAAWRESLELPPKDLHISLAFDAGGDVHGVPKGVSSLLASF